MIRWRPFGAHATRRITYKPSGARATPSKIDEDELLLFLCDEHHGDLNEEQKSLARRCRGEMRTAYGAAMFRLMLCEEMLNRGMAADFRTCRSIFFPKGGDAPWLQNRAV